MSPVVAEWTPADACHLQLALRLTNEAFAERLGSAPRTIAKWHANPAMRLTLEMQQALDTMLGRAHVDEQQRFETLRGAPRSTGIRPRSVWALEIDEATHLAPALDWLDGIRRVAPGTSAADVEVRLQGTGEREVRSAARARGQVDRRDVAQAVQEFYRETMPAGYGMVMLGQKSGHTETSILTHNDWIDVDLDLRVHSRGAFVLRHADRVSVEATPELVTAGIERLAEALVHRTRFVDAPVYRLLQTATAGSGVGAAFGMADFGRYALTWDLLEAELIELVLGVRADLPLRQHLLPTVTSVLAAEERLCVGGAQALCAFARPATSERPSDYVVLVQARSPRVLNATGRLAAIPKCFHQPINDYSGEVSIAASLLRELEEELFGRDELDGSAVSRPMADPMHPSRLTVPMRWLHESADWQLHETGFGFNLVAGNYEFSSLLVVHDEDFWDRYGGTIEGNWEASALRRYSSMDTEGIATLLADPMWSDEGLVTVALGLKRLAELDPNRTALPAFEVGVTS